MSKLKNAAFGFFNTFIPKLAQPNIMGESDKNIYNNYSILDSLMEGCQIIGFDWCYRYINKAAEIHNQCTKEKLVGKKYMDMWPGIEKTEVFQFIRHCMEERTLQHTESNFTFSDGSEEWFDLSIQPVPEGVFILSIDITERKRAELKMRVSEARLSVIFHNSPVGLLMVHLADSRIVDVNNAFANLSGYTRDEIIGQSFMELNLWACQADSDAMLKQMREQGNCDMEIKVRKKDGEIRDFRISLKLIEIKGDQFSIWIAQDITNNKETEEVLRKSIEKYQIISENSADVIWTLDLTTRKFTYVSPSVFNLRGMTPEEVMEQPMEAAMTPASYLKVTASLPDLIAAFHAGDQDRRIHTTEVDQIHKNGSIIPTEVVTTPLTDSTGQIVEILGISRDISERRRTELALRESESKFRKIYEDGPFGMVLADSDFKFISANSTFCEMVGYTEAELQNQTFGDITFADDLVIDLPNIRKLVNKEMPVYKTEKRYIRKDGMLIWGALTVTANFNKDEQFIYTLAIIEDITSRKETEAKLGKMTERLELATHSAGIGTWDLDIPSHKLVWDEQIYKLFGFSQGKFPEAYEALLNGLHPDDRELSNEIAQQAIRGERDYDTEYRIVWPDGSVHWLKSIGQVFYDVNRTPVRMVGLKYDITRHKQADEALKESETLFSTIFRSSPIPISITEITAEKWIEINDAFLKITGYTREEVIDHNYQEINLLKRIEERDKMQKMLMEHGRVINYEVEINKKDGSTAIMLISVELVELKGKPYLLIMGNDITEGKQAELQLKEKTEKIAVQNEEYQQLNKALLQINNELEEAKERAEKSDHLKTAFLQNMSHEIRTPMNAIMGFSELLVQNYNNKYKLEKFSEIINQSCNDLLYIINEILDIARIESGQLPINIEECKLSTLFSEISSFFREVQKRQKKHHIVFNVQMHGETEGYSIHTDKVKVKQILINLIGNAFKFTDNGEIQAGCKLDDNQQLLFYVSDTGIGIPHDKQDLIFERFTQLESTPHHFYGGTGLGLSIVKGLVDLLGGKIWLESELSKGSTFYFSIPYNKVDHLSDEQILNETREKYNFSGKTVLIVEDDKYNSDYLKEVLEGTGIKIIHSFYGKEAIQIARSEKLDIILMDVRLPDMDGYEATRMIKKHKPELNIIAQTAYAALDEKEKAILAGCDDYISKPVKQDLLLSLINKQFSKY
jgi:PAS domain S-box-containing protein